MQLELVYAQKEYFNPNGDKVKDRKPVGEVKDHHLYLYMFPNLELLIEPLAESKHLSRVLLLHTYYQDDTKHTKRYPIGSVKQAQHKKYLNLNMFRDAVYTIKRVETNPGEAITQ